MAKAESQGGGGTEETEGTISPYSFILFALALDTLFEEYLCLSVGETSQAQGHSRGRGEENGSKEEGGGGTSPT